MELVIILSIGILGFILGRYSLKRNLQAFNDAYEKPIVNGKTYDEFKSELPEFVGNLLDVAHSYGWNDKINRKIGFKIEKRYNDTKKEISLDQSKM